MANSGNPLAARYVLRGMLLGMMVLLGFAVIAGMYVLRTPPLRAALPWSAAEIRDRLIPGPPLEYLLRARLSRPEFDAYVARLRLQPLSAAAVEQIGLDWTAVAPAPEWWSPDLAAGSAFYAGDRAAWTLVQHRGDTLYVRSVVPASAAGPGSAPPAAP